MVVQAVFAYELPFFDHMTSIRGKSHAKNVEKDSKLRLSMGRGIS